MRCQAIYSPTRADDISLGVLWQAHHGDSTDMQIIINGPESVQAVRLGIAHTESGEGRIVDGTLQEGVAHRFSGQG